MDDPFFEPRHNHAVKYANNNDDDADAVFLWLFSCLFTATVTFVLLGMMYNIESSLDDIFTYLQHGAVTKAQHDVIQAFAALQQNY